MWAFAAASLPPLICAQRNTGLLRISKYEGAFYRSARTSRRQKPHTAVLRICGFWIVLWLACMDVLGKTDFKLASLSREINPEQHLITDCRRK